MFPGWGSQCTRPQRNICAEKRSTIVVIISFRERPSPPLPFGPRHSLRSGFINPVPSLGRIGEGMLSAACFAPGDPLP